MLVTQILKAKPQQGTIHVVPGASVSEAAKLMSEHRIGTVLVSNTGTDLVGILSERDIVRELGRRGAPCLSDKVDDMMTAKIITCVAEDTVEGVLAKMTEGRFRHMPVMDGDSIVGLISIGDVVKAQLLELEMEKDALQGMIMGH